MAESPKRSSGDFTKKVQRRLSRSKEKVRTRLLVSSEKTNCCYSEACAFCPCRYCKGWERRWRPETTNLTAVSKGLMTSRWLIPSPAEKMQFFVFIFWWLNRLCCKFPLLHCVRTHWGDLLTTLSESDPIRVIHLHTDKPLVYLQTDGNRMYKDLKNYINAVRGGNAFEFAAGL